MRYGPTTKEITTSPWNKNSSTSSSNLALQFPSNDTTKMSSWSNRYGNESESRRNVTEVVLSRNVTQSNRGDDVLGGSPIETTVSQRNDYGCIERGNASYCYGNVYRRDELHHRHITAGREVVFRYAESPASSTEHLNDTFNSFHAVRSNVDTHYSQDSINRVGSVGHQYRSQRNTQNMHAPPRDITLQSLYGANDDKQEWYKTSHVVINSERDVPDIVESESSSLDYSLDQDEQPIVHNSASTRLHNGRPRPTNFQGHDDRTSGYRYRPVKYQSEDGMNQYDQKYVPFTGSSGRRISAEASYTRKAKSDDMKNNGAGAVKCMMIEIAPGEYARLRGADETWKAIKYDFFVPCVCTCCTLTLFCIQDATYVLCPECRVVCPLENNCGDNGGVGLGFKIEDLVDWQKEIENDSRTHRKDQS
jgi:hypothetical protein